MPDQQEKISSKVIRNQDQGLVGKDDDFLWEKRKRYKEGKKKIDASTVLRKIINSNKTITFGCTVYHYYKFANYVVLECIEVTINKRHEFIIASHKHSSENYKIIDVQTSI